MAHDDSGSFAVAVTTYLKNEALEGSLASIPEIGNVSSVCVCDDGDGFGEEIATKYNKLNESGDYPCEVVYKTGPRGGVALNKNRGIKWYLEERKEPFKIMLDDDIKFTRFKSAMGAPETLSGAFLEAYKNTGIPHITAFLSGINEEAGTNNLLTIKPITAYNEHIIKYPMCQGICLFITREILEKIKYFNTGWKAHYGYEHALWTARINRYIGRSPENFTILSGSFRYFCCQNIGNNYSIPDAHANSSQYRKLLKDVYSGVGLTVNNSGV